MLPSDDQPLELQVDAALAEYLQKCDAGELPDREHFLERHPELREQLAELLSAADWIEQLAGPRLADIAQVNAASPQPLKSQDVSLSTVDFDPKPTIQPFAQMGSGPDCDDPTSEPMRHGRSTSEVERPQQLPTMTRFFNTVLDCRLKCQLQPMELRAVLTTVFTVSVWRLHT
ncbi:MAG: hypothetical protein R3C56_25380 [Pirellulaceae bacterium]